MAKQEAKPTKQVLSVEAALIRTGRYVPRRVDIRLHNSAAQKLRDLFDGLYASNAKLKSGRELEKPQHAVLWLLENLAPAQGSQTKAEK